MNRRYYLENIALVIVTFLFALVLAGCGSKPIPSDPEAELTLCGAVMEALQGGSYHITTRRDYVNSGTYAEFEHWKNGEDWMDLSKHKEIDVFFATLYCEEQAFDNLANHKEMDWLKNIQWGVSSETVQKIPLWLEDCRWEDQQVRLLSSQKRGRGRSVLVQFLSPYQTGIGAAEDYTVEFHFDKKGELEKAVMTVAFEDSMGVEARWVDEMVIHSTDSNDIAAEIDREYRRALKQNQMNP